MARYVLDIFPLQCSRTVAFDNLALVTDEELVVRFNANNFPDQPEMTRRAWRASEPENESLADNIRHQLVLDLDFAYRDIDDPVAHDYLGRAHVPIQGLTPYPVIAVVFDQDEYENEDDEDGNRDRYRIQESGNPVVRLRMAGICNELLVDPAESDSVQEMNLAINRIQGHQNVEQFPSGFTTTIPSYVAAHGTTGIQWATTPIYRTATVCYDGDPFEPDDAPDMEF